MRQLCERAVERVRGLRALTYELVEQILEVLGEKFDVVAGPIIPSERGGWHTFLKVREELKKDE